MKTRLPLEITFEEGLWMARSSEIQGLLVTGTTLDRLFAELPIVSQTLFDVCQEQGWAFVKNQSNVLPDDIVWVFELPQPALLAA